MLSKEKINELAAEAIEAVSVKIPEDTRWWLPEHFYQEFARLIIQEISTERQTSSERTEGTCDVMNAILSCPHTITHEYIVLHYDPKQLGHNALSQLRYRISVTKELC